MDLESCIRKAQAGEIDRYGDVVRAFQGRLRAFIASFCPNRDLVEEVAQRTFVWAYEHLAEYQPDTHFYRWLKAIARTIMMAELEALRRGTRNRRAYLEYLQACSGRNRLRTEDTDSEGELLDALRRCLAKLTERCRWLIRRRYEERGSTNAIAAELGTTPNTVKVTLFRIRRSLKRCVEGLIADVRGVRSDG